LQTGRSEVRVGIIAGYGFGLSGGLRREKGFYGQGVDGGQRGHAEGDQKVTSFHIQFNFGGASIGTDFRIYYTAPW